MICDFYSIFYIILPVRVSSDMQKTAADSFESADAAPGFWRWLCVFSAGDSLFPEYSGITVRTLWRRRLEFGLRTALAMAIGLVFYSYNISNVFVAIFAASESQPVLLFDR